MRELSKSEVTDVAGAAIGPDIAFIVATGWAGTVVGVAVGDIVPGPGNIAGAAAGFVIGVLIGVGALLATGAGAPAGAAPSSPAPDKNNGGS